MKPDRYQTLLIRKDPHDHEAVTLQAITEEPAFRKWVQDGNIVIAQQRIGETFDFNKAARYPSFLPMERVAFTVSELINTDEGVVAELTMNEDMSEEVRKIVMSPTAAIAPLTFRESGTIIGILGFVISDDTDKPNPIKVLRDVEHNIQGVANASA